MPVSPGGLRRWPQRQVTTYKLLAPPDHDGHSGGILRNGFQRGERSDAGQPAVPHHIQCGIVRGRPAMGERDHGRGGSKGSNETTVPSLA